MKNYNNSFFRSYFALFRPKIGHFQRFFRFWPLFSLRGGSKQFFSPKFIFVSFIYISGFKKSYLKTLYFLVEFLYVFLENPKNRFISLSYCFFKNLKFSLSIWWGNLVLLQKLSKSFWILTIWVLQKANQDKFGGFEFFPS